MKKTVIFDLDGTLLDSIHSIKYCTDLVMEKYGYGPFSVKQYQYFVGSSRNLFTGQTSEDGVVILKNNL